MKNIPTKVNNYNLYNKADRLLGVGDEVPLPDFEAVSETVSGAGILGEIDDPTIGYFGNMEMEIPFRTVDEEAVDMLDMTKAVHLTIRGAVQEINPEGDIVPKPVRVVVRGRAAKFSPGKLKKGNPMDSSVTLTVLYIFIEIDGKPAVELDKLNPTYKINGKDMLAGIKEMC